MTTGKRMLGNLHQTTKACSGAGEIRCRTILPHPEEILHMFMVKIISQHVLGVYSIAWPWSLLCRLFLQLLLEAKQILFDQRAPGLAILKGGES
jgi:hypothetical protein